MILSCMSIHEQNTRGKEKKKWQRLAWIHKTGTLPLIAALVIILIGLMVWMSQRSEQTEQVVEDVNAVEAVEEEPLEIETAEEEIPTEFQDNLDGAFEDLDAADL